MNKLQTGFTLIELLVVMTIILILAGLSLAGLSVLKDRQLRLEANRDLDGMTMAVGQYLVDYGVLGETSDGTDFEDTPFTFLTVRPTNTGDLVFFEPKSDRMGNLDGGQFSLTSDIDQFTTYMDPWGGYYRFKVVNQTKRSITSTSEVLIYTKADNDDRAIGRSLKIADGEWRRKEGTEALP